MENNYIVDFQQITISQQDIPVLTDVSLQIEPDEFVYLVGKVGSGKTTLIKTMNAELCPSKGHAVVAGYQLNSIKDKDIPFLRRKIGIVFQDFKLLTDRTIYENLQFVLKATGWKNKEECHQQIISVLDKVELRRKADKLPYQLSGGEQQRVAIARALLNNPQLILADEPTGNLDSETSEDIIRLFLDINYHQGPAIIMATHNINLMKKYPARTLKCEGGTVVTVHNDMEIDFISD
jgi:cell division transport system ATP-binding protein